MSAQDSSRYRYRASSFGCAGFCSWFTGSSVERKVFASVVAKEIVGRDLLLGQKIDLASWLFH